MWLLSLKSVLFTLFIQSGASVTKTENEHVFQAEQLYRFSSFRPGVVYFRNGTRTMTPLNYNYQLAQFQFIDLNHDTLLITGREKIDRVEIGIAVFYLSENDGDLELIQKFDEVKLVQKSEWATAGDRASHSNQKFTSDPAVPNALSINIQGGSVEWYNNPSKPNHKIKSSYYLRDYNSRFHEATKNNFLKIFARKKPALNRYFRERRVDFRKEADLLALLEYCDRLF